jgi:hypothetical protein
MLEQFKKKYALFLISYTCSPRIQPCDNDSKQWVTCSVAALARLVDGDGRSNAKRSGTAVVPKHGRSQGALKGLGGKPYQ